MVRAQETGATAEEIAVRAGMDVGRVKGLIAEGPKMAPVKSQSRRGLPALTLMAWAKVWRREKPWR